MQQHTHFWHQRRLLSQRRLLTLLSAGALLALLVVAGWGTALAAPASGGPSINIINFAGNTLTLQFDNWVIGQTITLSYSPASDCQGDLPLPNATFPVASSSFQANYTWPSTGIQPGTYYLCATDPQDGTQTSPQTVPVTGTGAVQPTPSPPVSTSTPSGTGSTPTPPPAGTPVTSTPGNEGTSAPGPNNTSNAGSNTLVAIILLCLLVLALLVYLIRWWLMQGRSTSSGGGPRTP